MKKLTLSILLIVAGYALGMAQQTLWVTTGQVSYGFDTQQVGQMAFSSNGDSITIQNKTMALCDIDSMYVTSGLMEYNTVLVDYAGENAYVKIAGNIACRMTADVDGAHVSLLQDDLVTEEIFYTLAGASTDGSFYMDGKLKATIILDGLTLTSSRGAALTVDDGKRIEVQVNDGTVNTLVDCANGMQKGCMVIEGHAEFKGGGTLQLTGNTKHAFKGDEYVELKKSFLGNIIVKNALGDGINTNQYIEIKGGNIIVENCEGDGVQVDKKADETKEFNGQLIVSGGTLRVLRTGDEGRGLKIEDAITISGGLIEVTSDDNAIHSKGGDFIISGGQVYAYSANAHGINTSGPLTISGGTVVAYAASTVGYGLRSTEQLSITGGTVAAVGAMCSTPAQVDNCQPALSYYGVLTQDTNLALNASDGTEVLAMTITRNYSSSKQHTLLLTAPTIATGNVYTLTSGATLDTEQDNWHSLYTTGNAVDVPGDTALGTATATTPYAELN